MNWYYAEGGEQRGPVSAEELAGLARAGTVTDQTLIWHEGLPAWEPFATHRATVAPDLPAPDPVTGIPPATADAGRPACSVCGQAFPPGDTVVIGGHRTCAGCKPLLLLRLEQGAIGVGSDAGAAAGAGVPEEVVAARDYTVDATALVGQAWNLVFSDPAVLLLGPILGTIAYYAVVAVSSVLQLIPVAGGLLAAVLINLAMGPFLAGVYALFLARLRGQAADVSTVFAGCTRRVKDLLLVRGYLALFTVALNGVLLLTLGSAVLGFRFTPGGAPPQLPPLSTALAGGTGYLLVLLVYLYFAVGWVWAVPLVFDKGYDWQSALRLSREVVGRHWWQHFWMMFLGGLLVTAGMLACCVGALVAIPVFLAMMALQYHRLFNDLAPADSQP